VAILLSGDLSLLRDSQSRIRHVESPNTDSSLAFAAIFEQLGTVLSRLLVREPISGSSFFKFKISCN